MTTKNLAEMWAAAAEHGTARNAHFNAITNYERVKK